MTAWVNLGWLLPNRLRSGMPVWGIAGLFVAAMAGIYSLYNMALNERITDVLRVLDQLPK